MVDNAAPVNGAFTEYRFRELKERVDDMQRENDKFIESATTFRVAMTERMARLEVILIVFVPLLSAVIGEAFHVILK